MPANYTKEQIQEANLESAADMIRDNMANDIWWLCRGVTAIYKHQTDDEKNTESTKHNNKVGFNGLDAAILSSFAVQINKWFNNPAARKFNVPLSPKQQALARKKMAKYATQLARVAKGIAAD